MSIKPTRATPESWVASCCNWSASRPTYQEASIALDEHCRVNHPLGQSPEINPSYSIHISDNAGHTLYHGTAREVIFEWREDKIIFTIPRQ